MASPATTTSSFIPRSFASRTIKASVKWDEKYLVPPSCQKSNLYQDIVAPWQTSIYSNLPSPFRIELHLALRNMVVYVTTLALIHGSLLWNFSIEALIFHSFVMALFYFKVNVVLSIEKTLLRKNCITRVISISLTCICYIIGLFLWSRNVSFTIQLHTIFIPLVITAAARQISTGNAIRKPYYPNAASIITSLLNCILLSYSDGMFLKTTYQFTDHLIFHQGLVDKLFYTIVLNSVSVRLATTLYMQTLNADTCATSSKSRRTYDGNRSLFYCIFALQLIAVVWQTAEAVITCRIPDRMFTLSRAISLSSACHALYLLRSIEPHISPVFKIPDLKPASNQIVLTPEMLSNHTRTPVVAA